ncbi:MAG: Na+:solute symporter [Planctomycetes bacterium]|nr:Na+:solute symporter [Planctomycetota bacterium]
MAPMTVLHPLDLAVIAIYLVGILALGMAFRRRASRDATSYFLARRSLPWWILGTSMAATTFAADTPLAVTGFVRDHGIWFNWFGWHYVLGQTLAVFLFSRFWRRAGVLTDNELIELRYAGKPAAGLRAFKAFYFAILYNFIVLGWVLKGMATVAETILGVDPTLAVLAGASLALAYALLAGFWGVAVTDVLQFLLAMAGSILLAVIAITRIGGITELKTRLLESPLSTADTLAVVPGGGLGLEDNFFRFLVFVTVMWWATHNADGGGYLIQRMAAARNERDARAATLWYVIAVNAVRYWPWILAALASLVLLPASAVGENSEAAYPLLIRELLGPGLVGLMLVSFLAAFMSTIDTHLNWGASYLTSDIYLRFLRPQATARETVIVAKCCVAAMMVMAAVVAHFLTNIATAWLFVWAMGAGIGPVLILRWFWWRINAWSEIAALGSSVLIALGFEVASAAQAGAAYRLFSTPLNISGLVLATHHKALVLVPVSVLVWLAVTLATRPVPPAQLAAFFRRVRPGGAWRPVAHRCADVVPDGLNRHTVLAWLGGVALVYGLLFGLGKLLLGEAGPAALLFVLAIAGMVPVVRELRR